MAIARFVANRTKLAGSDDLERAKADAVVLTNMDLQNLYYDKVHPFKKDADKFELVKKSFFENEVPLYLDRFESLVKLYGSKGYSVGDSLKWSDLCIYDTISVLFFIDMDAKLLERYPRVRDVFKTVEDNPIIKEYVKTRPETSF